MFKLLPLLPWLKGETERLLIAAARGSDPELRASAMFDDLPDQYEHLVPVMGEVLARADWFQLFSMLDARVQQYEEWFAQVRASLLAAIAEETGIVYGAQTAAGIDPETGRQIINVQGPGESGAGAASIVSPQPVHLATPAPARQMPSRRDAPSRRDPNAPVERPGPLPPLTAEAPDTGE